MTIENIPTFGSQESGVTYVDRPGAYAFLLNKHFELAILQTKYGTFLPGGGLDPGESEIVGLSRELHEEMGVKLLTAEIVCRSAQFLYSRHYKQHFRKIGSFYRVELAQPIRLKLEKDHELLWVDQRHAGLELSEESQRWAVERI